MIYVELALIIFLILLNGILAMAEIAIVSSRRARLQAMVDQGVIGARGALALTNDPGKFLSTVQIGITLIGVVSGAVSGATIGLRLGLWLTALGVTPTYAEPIGVTLVVVVITYFSLIVGELTPKQLALRNPEQIAVRVAPPMMVVARLGAPLVWLLNTSAKSLLRMLGYGALSERGVTDEEIRSLVAEAESSGVIEPGERTMITGVMRLGDRPVQAVMTPRRQVDMIDLSDEPESIRKAIVKSVHSRLPVHDGAPDEILGVLQAKDLLDAYIAGEHPDVRAHMRQAPVVPDIADALDVVRIIKSSAIHLVLVHDEYGHFEGVVTNADILEAIVGASRTDEGAAEPDAVRREDGSLLLSGSMAVDEMAERLGIVIPQERAYHTAAGFVLDRLGHLPAIGETFNDQGWRFEIVDLDGRRIDKILADRVSGGPRRAN